MGIKYIGNRISPHSKFSVQYGVAYEKNVPISDPVKVRKVIAKYKHAIENNWIIVISIVLKDGNRERLTRSQKVAKIYLNDREFPTDHYIVRPSMFSLYGKISDDKKHIPPFCVSHYQEEALKFSEKKASSVKNILDVEGIVGVSIRKYYPSLPEEYVRYEVEITDSIEHRFSLMDFD